MSIKKIFFQYAFVSSVKTWKYRLSLDQGRTQNFSSKEKNEPLLVLDWDEISVLDLAKRLVYSITGVHNSIYWIIHFKCYCFQHKKKRWWNCKQKN